MTGVDKLMDLAEREGIYHMRKGDCVELFCEERVAFAECVEDQTVAVRMSTGVYASGENELSVRAVAKHLDAWGYKATRFAVEEDGEVVASCTRDLRNAETLAEMLEHVAGAIKKGGPCLAAAANGAFPREAIAANCTMPPSVLTASLSEQAEPRALCNEGVPDDSNASDCLQ